MDAVLPAHGSSSGVYYRALYARNDGSTRLENVLPEAAYTTEEHYTKEARYTSMPLRRFCPKGCTRCRPRWENPDRPKVIRASMNPYLILPAVQETMPVRLDKAGQQRNLACIRGVNAVGSPIPPVGGKDSCVRQRNSGCRAGLDSISTSVE